jgi:glycosyltransferase involved in cell wall biosynthesis
MKVLALIAASDVSGPCRGLFQLVEQMKDTGVGFILGMFLVKRVTTSPSIEEAQRRGFCVEVLSQARRYDPGLMRQARNIVRQHRVAIVQSHGYKGALLAWVLHRMSGIPWVAFAHGYTNENRRIGLYNRLDVWLLKRADRVVAVSEAMGRLLEGFGVPSRRITVIHNAIDPKEYAVNPDREKFRRSWNIESGELLIGVVGRLSPEKGHALFVDAFQQVVRAVPQARAVFVGEGQELRSLREAIRSRALEGRIFFAGYQSDMSSVYAALDIVAIPSLSEGLPNALLEAMLFGKAVVATAIGGIPEVMSRACNRWIVPPGDIDQLARAMIESLSNPELRDVAGHVNAALVREQFSPPRRAEQVLQIYRELRPT